MITLLGSIVSAINGSAVALISVSHAWGIVSLLALLAIAYWIVQSTKFFLRKARIHSFALGAAMALAMMASYVFAETQISASLMGTDFAGFYVSRWQSGLTLFGSGSWAIGGWLWAVCYVLKMLLLLILFFGAAADEGDRPFCESCGSATTQLVWKQTVGRYDTDNLKAYAGTNGQWNLGGLMTMLEQDQSGGSAIYIRIWTCACGLRFEFKAEAYDLSTKIAGSELVGFLPMGAAGVSGIVQWVWSIDPETEIPEALLAIYRDNPPVDSPDESDW